MLGTKTEVKNLNSFSAVERALDFEFARQCELLARGDKIVQHTLLWDTAKGEARVSRTKEESHDYRYFPEPDLGPLVIDPDWLHIVRESLPELPGQRKTRFALDYSLETSTVDQLTASPELADYFEGVARASGDAKAAANWVMGEVMATINATGATLATFRVRPADLARLLDLVRDGIVSHSAGKRIFARMVETGDRPEQIAEREGLTQVGDDSALRGWIDEVFAASPTEAGRFTAGERKLQGVLVGMVMKKSGGRADPKRVNQLLAERLAG